MSGIGEVCFALFVPINMHTEMHVFAYVYIEMLFYTDNVQ